MAQQKRVDAVFEGGGVKGIGLVGAAAVVEENGYTWDNLAGTSTGAIVASLLAAGYTAAELKDIIGSVSMSIPFFFRPFKIDKACFVDGGILSNFPVWLFDSEGEPEWPTFGFKLVEPTEGKPNDTGSTPPASNPPARSSRPGISTNTSATTASGTTTPTSRRCSG